MINNDPGLDVPFLQAEIEVILQEIDRVTKENQTLDWEIPSQYDRLLRNADRVKVLEYRLATIQGYLNRVLPEGYLVGAPATSPSPSEPEFDLIQKGHLTLIRRKEKACQ